AISYFVIPPATRDTTSASRSRTDSVTVRIYNDKNEVIRNLKWKADTGMNRRYWGMEERGFRNPGQPVRRPGAPEQGGQQVMPGTYKVVLTLGNNSDSTLVVVKDDPRLGDRSAVRTAQRQLQDRLRKSVDKLTAGMDRLTEAEEVTRKIDAQLRDMQGREIDSLRKATKAMQDSIKAIREFISGKPQDRQGTGNVPQVTVMSRLQQANQGITSKPIKPGQQEELMVGWAETAIAQAIQRINGFFDGKWKDYRRQAENTPVKLFKDYNPL
ncbi:MAG TPA: hypothetical protein VFZ47_09370, partial [Chitinophagaceae bacterium]